MKPSIRLISGKEFNYQTPDPNSITIHDVCNGLSRLPRFVAQTPTDIFVSDHSIFVYKLVCKQTENGWVRLAALLHDASESVTGDIPGPLKQLIPGLREIEKNIQVAILIGIWRKHLKHELGIEQARRMAIDSLIKEEDINALEIEKIKFIPPTSWWSLDPAAKKWLKANSGILYPQQEENDIVEFNRKWRQENFMQYFRKAVTEAKKWTKTWEQQWRDENG